MAATRRPIAAEALVPAPAQEVFGYLSDLKNHWKLADRFIEVVSLERSGDGGEQAPASGGRVRIRGPFGVRRTAATRVAAIEPPDRMTGFAQVGRRTRAEVRWTLTGSRGQTRVRLEARVLGAGPLDRVVLGLGGRAWLRRRFAGVLEHLRQRFSPDARAGRLDADFSLGAAVALVARVGRIWLHGVRRRLRRTAVPRSIRP